MRRDLTKSFEWDARVRRVWKTADGKTHVKLVLSDTKVDRQRERVALGLLKKFRAKLRQGTVPLLRTHHDTFPIGKFVDGRLSKMMDDGDHWELTGEAELDERYPEAQTLYDDAQKGDCPWQASIGGLLNLANPDCVAWERDKEFGVIRVLQDGDLDHVAVTRKGHAANPRTRFTDGVRKAMVDVLRMEDPPDWVKSDDMVAFTQQGLALRRGVVAAAAALIKSSGVALDDRKAAAHHLVQQYGAFDLAVPTALLTMAKSGETPEGFTDEGWVREHADQGLDISGWYGQADPGEPDALGTPDAIQKELGMQALLKALTNLVQKSTATVEFPGGHKTFDAFVKSLEGKPDGEAMGLVETAMDLVIQGIQAPVAPVAKSQDDIAEFRKSIEATQLKGINALGAEIAKVVKEVEGLDGKVNAAVLKSVDAMTTSIATIGESVKALTARIDKMGESIPSSQIPADDDHATEPVVTKSGRKSVFGGVLLPKK